MYKILYIIFFSLIVTNCSFKPVVKHHGVPLLEKKQGSLIVNKSNKNDIIFKLGSPPIRSKFDDKECVGYFGHIELARPMFHMGYIDKVRMVLQCVCFDCGTLLIDEKDPTFHRTVDPLAGDGSKGGNPGEHLGIHGETMEIIAG